MKGRINHQDTKKKKWQKREENGAIATLSPYSLVCLLCALWFTLFRSHFMYNASR